MSIAARADIERLTQVLEDDRCPITRGAGGATARTGRGRRLCLGELSTDGHGCRVLWLAQPIASLSF